MTLELVAPSGEGANADRIRAVLAAQGEGLASICFRTSDIAKMHRRLDRLTLKPEPVAEVESRDAISGATLSWKRTRAATETTRGVRLFFLERDKERPLSVRTDDRIDHGDGPCRGLDGGSRTRRGALRRAARPRHGARPLASGLGPADVLPLRRPHRRGHAPAGQARTPTRRRTGCAACAGASPTSTRPMRGWLQAGVDVSEVRTGRKPGTRVMTVRSGTCGVPTLLVQPSARSRAAD